MSKQTFLRASHQAVVSALGKMDGALLTRAHCYFGGGTRIVLELGEYRESKDIGFLCASRDGYRLLREAVSHESLGALFRKAMPLAREVRTDQYGIRTFLETDAGKIKLEIVREVRIELEGEKVAALPVPCWRARTPLRRNSWPTRIVAWMHQPFRAIWSILRS
jgi:hypothetical protein